jgi:uncharacterized protein (TIGR02996 family)
MKVRRFEHVAKHRFWEIYWDDAEVEFVSGKIGTNGRATRPARTVSLEDEIAKRLREGYEEVVPEIVKNQTAPRVEIPEALMKRVLEAPDDDQPRMVVADWLQQQGDPLGELIAVQLEIARLDVVPKSLRDREENLLVAFRPRWLPVGANVDFVRGFADTVKLELPFERELLDQVVDVSPLLRTIVFAFPRDIYRWQLRRPWEDASLRALQHVTGLHMGGFETDDAGVDSLLALDLPRLDRLAMRSMALRPSHVKKLATRNWRELDLHANAVGNRGIDALAGQSNLAVLDVGSNGVTDAGALVLAALPLERLSLRRSQLARVPGKFPVLRSLDLSCCDLSPKYFAEYQMPSLVELSLRETGLTDIGLDALADTPLAAKLTTLDVGLNSITDVALFQRFPALRRLNISGNPLAQAAKAVKAELAHIRITARS